MTSANSPYFEDAEIQESVDMVLRYLRWSERESLTESGSRAIQKDGASPMLVSKLFSGLADQVELDREWLYVGGDGGPPPSQTTWGKAADYGKAV